MSLNKDKDFLAKVELALEQLRPYLESDGGNVILQEVTDDMVVKVQFIGACRDCKMSMMTLKAGLEQAVMRAVPEVTAVEAIDTTTYIES